MSRTGSFAVLAGLTLLAGGTIAATLTGHTADDIVLAPDDASVVGRGEKIYAAHCASCHGKQLEGEPNWQRRNADGYLPAPPHDATGHTWHHSDAQLFKLTKDGLAGLVGGDYKTRMPAYDGLLSDSDMVAVLSFIKSRWPDNIRKRHDRLNAAAKRNLQADQ